MALPSHIPFDPTPQAADSDRTIEGQRLERREHGRFCGKILWTP